MDCFYTIKLPNGGMLKIPAISNINSEDLILQELLNKYYVSGKDFTEIVKYLKDLKIPLEIDDVLEVLRKSTINSFVDNLNEALSTNSDYVHNIILRKVLQNQTTFTYVEGDEETEISYNNLLDILSKPIEANYINVINTIGIVGQKNAGDLEKEIYSKITSSYKLNIVPTIEENLHLLINKIFPNKSQQSFYPIAYNSNNSIVVKDDNLTNPIIFYSEYNLISILPGLIKYLGNNLTTEDLKDYIGNYSITEFFNGTFDKEVYNPEKILLNKNTSKELINLIISKNKDIYN